MPKDFATIGSRQRRAPNLKSVVEMGEQDKVVGEDSREHARRIAAELTLEEQVSLLGAADFWRTIAIPARGIPAIKMSDGPNGARGAFFKDGTPAALFPCGVSLAATWDVDLLAEIGEHLAEEVKARGANVLLAPTICMHRSPLGGRNFESFSEDPLLTGKLASSYISGLQSRGVSATVKHFVGNEQETNRMTINSVIEERPLREIYLKPFEIAIRESKPWALMTSYNLINGLHADMHIRLLQDILRREWQFDGLVMSDWTGVNSVVESITAGCDLEMPGPTRWRGKKVIKAVQEGKLDRRRVEESAANVINLVEKTKVLHGPKEPRERTDDTPERRRLIRRAGHDGLVLLKNEDILPLGDQCKTIALIGPNAKRAIAMGGGSASLKPYYTTSPYDGLKEAFKGKITSAKGCDTAKWLPLASRADCTTPSGRSGIILEYYAGDKFEGRPAYVEHKDGTDLCLWDSVPKDLLPAYSFKVKFSITPKTSGLHSISFASVGPGRLFVNQKLFIDNWNWTQEGEAMFEMSVDVVRKIRLEAGVKADIRVDSTNEIRPRSKLTPEGPRHRSGGCRIGYQEEKIDNLLQEAIDVAAKADVAVVCVGLDSEWESEGYDRPTIDLPLDGNQDRLVAAIAKANPRTIVINQSGTPISMPWVDEVQAIIQGWYQGQEAGRALADVLLGKCSPGGKLPVTFPKRVEDNPAYHNWPGECGRVVYGEGLFIGYRHYDSVKIPPLFPFGYGLSYTTFEYGRPRLSDHVLTQGGAITVSLHITNTGTVAGSEIVQVYISDIQSRLVRPEKELKAFAKVHLQPGESRPVEMVLDKHAVGYYDPSLKAWIAEKGDFEVLIGASSVDIRGHCSFEVKESFNWIF